MIKRIVKKYKGLLLLIIGSTLIIISVYLSLYTQIGLVKEQLFSEIDYMIKNNSNYCNCDNEVENDDNQENNDSSIGVNTDYVEIEDNESDKADEPSKPNNKKNYIGYLSIPRISLKYGFVDVDSYYNHVDRNIQIIEPSDFPDVPKGNFIIAGHSGNASISYFKNLYLLKIGDMANISYKNHTYNYKIVDIYKDDKDGNITIKRDTTKTTLTLITCSYKDKKNQTVYIAELESVL